MIGRAWSWSPDVEGAPSRSITVELRLVDVGEVEVTLGMMDPDPDGWGADELVLGPYRPDELDDLAVMLLAARGEADRWARETAR